MPECSTREFKPEDLRRVCEIELRSFSHPYPCQLFLVYYYLFPKLFLVAECDNLVVGYAVGVVENGDKGHLASIAVDENYRGRGLGRALIEEFEARIKTLGVFKVYLEVSIRNEVAISLYRKLGYSVVGLLRKYYPDGEDAYLMLKELK
ncbi:MAG: ribosomal protein S18-alanine N-acetyltransferase [Sulfolobales archaeon]|nr:ribosomal protein S18-alanine N-acetyltransferase [Sulfolobales archaeon]MDW8083474.1 ribosomal protein S18-alanine N-acetyltransferase [Sulfolobales archaeon]